MEEAMSTFKTPPPFVPSATDLNDMIRRAMARCDADIARQREARADERADRAAKAEVAARNRKFWER
jgi:hypothetical protein